jgi:putative transposase
MLNFKYRIYPTKKQQHLLEIHLEECRWLYNYFLEKRKNSWENEKKSLNYYSQAISIVKLKKERKSLDIVYSQVLQNVAVRVDLAFKSFFRRVKAKETPGYPRFKGTNRYDSFTFPQKGFEITNNKLKLSKIGTYKIKLHRKPEGKIKTCTIKRSATGKWYTIFSCLSEPKLLPNSDKNVGIDTGLKSFVTFSDGGKIENPRFFRKEENFLIKTQRKLSTAGKGTLERKKFKKIVSRIHERITNKRSNFTHQESRKIVNKYGIICIEDLSINKMVHNHCLSKSIMDAAWGQFAKYLSYKAENAGRKLIRVNPAYTSQTCSKCGHRESIKLSDRIYTCSCCKVSIDRDYNASLNILSLGLQTLGFTPESP